MPRLGVLGTLVWDTIRQRRSADDSEDDSQHDPAEIQDWGGIGYSLAAFEAVRPPGWTQFPIVKVGHDLRGPADTHISSLASAEVGGLQTVPEPNNRVTLYYEDQLRRCEHLSGGVPGWTIEELRPLTESCHALYVNFIAGWELDLETAMALRDSFAGPIYADIHSLMLSIGEDGVRRLRPLPRWREWLSCFDIVQVNEDELRTLDEAAPAWETAAAVAADGGRGENSYLRAVLVTLGGHGSAWSAAAADTRLADPPSGAEGVRMGCVGQAGGARRGDPTGCGDVWGMACFARLLAGSTLEEAMQTANSLAGSNVTTQGATGLAGILAGEDSNRTSQIA
ncbi:MAG: carbohydrate kinase family protein [Gemmatimonadota bacterium]